MFMGHSIGLEDHYFKPSDHDVLQEYISAVDFLTINEENRLKRKVIEITKKQDEIETLKQTHEHETNDIREQMNQIISMIQQNPTLAQIKPEALVKKAHRKANGHVASRIYEPEVGL
jgi:DNA-binding protein H-NS